MAGFRINNDDGTIEFGEDGQIKILNDGTIEISSSLVIPKASGNGIKVDTDSPTNTWRDIIGDVVPDITGAGSATLAAWRGGTYRVFFYTTNDRCDMVFHIPHDYVPGTDLFLHLHWGHNGTAISGQLVVTYGITYTKGHNQGNFGVEVAPVLTVATPDISTVPQYRHRIDEIQISMVGGSPSLIDTSLIEPDGIISVGFITTEKPTITGGSTNLPAFFTLDIHYQSTNIGTKQKAPNFYL